MSDDKGVLGNLPRSRPGRRSDKRAADAPDTAGPTTGGGAGRLADAADKAAGRAERTDAAAAKAPASKPPRRAPISKPPRPAAGKPRPAKRARPGAAAAPKSTPVPDPAAPKTAAAAGDPVTDAARAAAKAVGAGVKIGAGIAQEVFRRLPRP